MKLILHLIGPPRLMGARHRCELSAGSVSLGRSPDADWVIPDTERLISRIHLRVDASHGAFVLTDTSVNGVYVNAGTEAVGYGTSVELRNGDTLRVGEARIAVEIVASGPGAAAFPFDAKAFAAQIQQSEPAPGASRPPDPLGDPLGGPFGPAPAAERAPSRTVIDANWMTTPIAPPPSSTPPPVMPVRPEAAASGVLPMRPLRSAPEGAGGGHASAPGSVQAFVAARPDLTPRRLAAAIDAAGGDLDAETWQALYRRFQSFLDSDN